MKRFVDTRKALIGSRFAWWDTCTDMFEKHSGEMAWDTFAEFTSAYRGAELQRYRVLCPSWAFLVEGRPNSTADRLCAIFDPPNDLPLDRHGAVEISDVGAMIKDRINEVSNLRGVRKIRDFGSRVLPEVDYARVEERIMARIDPLHFLDGEIEHKDGDPTNNEVSNLRHVRKARELGAKYGVGHMDKFARSVKKMADEDARDLYKEFTEAHPEITRVWAMADAAKVETSIELLSRIERLEQAKALILSAETPAHDLTPRAQAMLVSLIAGGASPGEAAFRTLHKLGWVGVYEEKST